MKAKTFDKGTNAAKTVIHAAVFTGAGAAVTSLFKNTDMSGVKGIAKLCLGIGIMGTAHWVGNEASKTIDGEIDGITGLVKAFLVDKEVAEEEEDDEFFDEDEDEGEA